MDSRYESAVTSTQCSSLIGHIGSNGQRRSRQTFREGIGSIQLDETNQVSPSLVTPPITRLSSPKVLIEKPCNILFHFCSLTSR